MSKYYKEEDLIKALTGFVRETGIDETPYEYAEFALDKIPSIEIDEDCSWIYDENKKESKICCICGNPIEGFGHDPWPYKTEGRCCDACNYNVVIPRRIANLRKSETNTNPSCSTCTHENEKWNSDACFNCNQHSNYEARK